MIRTDPNNPRATTLDAALRARLDVRALPPELCLVIGGDGWMLSSIRALGPDYIFLGLNAGHLGFLLNDVSGELDAAAAALDAGRWQSWSFPRLKMTATPAEGDDFEAEAVNDVYVERFAGHTAYLQLHIDGVLVVERMVCDGLIVSTALGSTAYSFSAGGSPSHPLLRAVHVTPICPHSPRLSPVVLPESAEVAVSVLEHERRKARAVADGVDHGLIRQLRVQRASQDVRLAFLEGHRFTGTLIRKVLRA